jgi:hypothetical protein
VRVRETLEADHHMMIPRNMEIFVLRPGTILARRPLKLEVSMSDQWGKQSNSMYQKMKWFVGYPTWSIPFGKGFCLSLQPCGECPRLRFGPRRGPMYCLETGVSFISNGNRHLFNLWWAVLDISHSSPIVMRASISQSVRVYDLK